MSFHLTEVEKGRLIALKEEGYNNGACARKIGRSIKTVKKWWRRYEEEGEAGLRKKKTSGRPRSTTPAQDAAIAAVSSPPETLRAKEANNVFRCVPSLKKY